MAKRSADAESRFLSLGCVVCALALIPLAFRPWLEIQWSSSFPPESSTTDLGGDGLLGLTDLGDGRIVVALALVTAVIASLSFALRQGRQFVAPVLMFMGAAIFVIAGYDITHDWRSEYGFTPHLNITDIDVSLELWATLALSVALFLGGLALLLLKNKATSLDLDTSPQQM